MFNILTPMFISFAAAAMLRSLSQRAC